MPLTPGDLLARRYRVQGELAPQGELSRWAALDEATGEPVELCLPSAGSLLSPGAREFFELSWSGGLHTLAARHPVRDRFEWEGRPVGVRPTLQNLLPTSFVLGPAEAIAWAGHLSPALSDPALSRGYDRLDLAIDEEGRPVWAPRGLMPRSTLSHGQAEADPFARLMLDLLGVPPDSGVGRSVATLLPTATPELHALVDAFRRGERPKLSAAPPQRLVVEKDLPSTQMPSLTPSNLSSRTFEAKDPRIPTLRASIQPPNIGVVLDQAPTEAARLRVEALLDLQPGALERLQQSAGPLIVGGGRTPAEGHALIERLHQIGVRARMAPVVNGRSYLTPIAIAGVGTVFAMILGLLLGPLASLVGALVSLLAAVGAAFRPRTELEYGQTSIALRNLHQPLPEDGLALALRSLQAARKQVLQLDLPEPARDDLLDSLQDLQQSLPTNASGPEEPPQARAVRIAAQELIEGITSVHQPSQGISASQARARAAVAALAKGLA